jgi:hypothetical protein
MTVIYSTVSRARPGRRLDAVAAAAEGKKVVERDGAMDCRLSVATTAGEASGTFIFTMQFDSNEAYGAFADQAAEDQELAALTERLDHEDSPIMIEAQSLGAEIPLDRPVKAGRGRAIQAYLSRPLPGRFEGALDLARQAFDFVEANGAVNARLFTLLSAGSMTDALVVSWELESMRALGRVGDAYLTDPAGQALMQAMTGPDCPVTTISSGIYTEIPI